MAHAQRRRRGRGSRPAARRRGSDAHRASLADDVSPAFLARQRHRPRHRHERHRHRALGHPRQGARRSLPQAVGRPGARLRPDSTAISAAARWRISTRRRRARSASASSRARQVEDGFTAFKSMAVPPTMPIEGCSPIRARRGVRGGDARRGRRSIDIMVDCHARPSPRMGLLFAKALEPYGLYWFEEPCWPESVDGMAAIQRGGEHADRDRRARRRALAPFRELLDEARLRASASPTSRTAAASPRRGASPPWPRRTASPSRRTTRRARSARPPRSSSASREPCYIICEAVTSDVPWRDEVATQSHPIDPAGMLARATDKPGLGIEIDLDVVAKHPFEPELLQRVFYADGSVGDW